MNISIIGYGKMGKEIERCALERGHNISLIIDSENLSDINPEKLAGTDVIIEFTSPESAAEIIIRSLSMGVSVVSGTTGWLSRYPEAVEACKKGDSSFIYSSNYSLGVNMFFRINSVLSLIMDKNPSYAADIAEIHHTQKVDAPSGTAIRLAQLISEGHNRYSGWKTQGEPGQELIPVESERKDDVPGTHHVTWTSEFDKMVLTHEAFGRKGFALGAVAAAEYIAGKKGIFTMDHVLGF